MKKKDQNIISDLLSKLQAAYSAPSKKEHAKPKKKASDAVDLELEDKLREVLSEITPTSPTKSAKAPKKEPKIKIPNTPLKKEEKTEDISSTSEQKEEEIEISFSTEEASENQEKPISTTDAEEESTILAESQDTKLPSPTISKSKKSKRSSSSTTYSKKQSKKKKYNSTKEGSTEQSTPVSDISPEEEVPSEAQKEDLPPVSPVEEPEREVPKAEKEVVLPEITPTEAPETPSPVEDVPQETEVSDVSNSEASDTSEVSDASDVTEQLIAPSIETPTQQTSTSAKKAFLAESLPEQKPKQSAPIRITPKAAPAPMSTASSNSPVSPSASEPIVIRPKEYTPDKAARQSADSIVIRPAAHSLNGQSATVIRPRTPEQAPTPTPVEPEFTSNEPIKIGKKVDADMNNNIQTPKQNTEAAPKATEAKREPTVTMVPPDTRFSASASPKTAPKKEPTVTMVPQDDRFTAKRDDTPKAQSSAPERVTSTPAQSVSPEPRRTHASSPHHPPRDASDARHPTRRKEPPTPMPKLSPEDEKLEEVLDEIPQQELPIENITDASAVPTPMDDAAPTYESVSSERSSHIDEDRALYEAVYRRSGLTEDDINMMFELGYENELGRVVGYENLKKLKYAHLRLKSKTHRKHYRTAFGYRGEEYGGTQDREKVLAAYHKDRIRLTLRAIATALLTLLLFFVDMPQIIGDSFVSLLSVHFLIIPAAELVLLLLCAACSLRQLNAGIRQFYKFAPTPYSVCAVVIPLALVYEILMFFFSLPTLGFVFALSLLMTVLCDVLRMSCELRAFHILSAEGRKTVLDEASPRKKKLRQGERIVKIISDDIGESSYRVRTAEQTVGFFRRFNSMQSAAKPFMTLLLIMLFASVTAAFTVAVITLSLTEAIKAFITVLAVCSPISAIFSYFYPLFRANRLLSHCNCAIVGEEGVEEYDRQKTVIFEDTDFLTAKRHSETVLREDYDLSRDRRLSECLFQKLGGTLGQITTTLAKLHKDAPVSIVRITDGGVEAMIENKYHILAGKEQFLRRNGIKIPKESSDRELRRTPNISLMYVAIDGVLKLSYEIEYTVNSEFEEKIAELSFYDTTVGIHTYDPNLSDEFLAGMRRENDDPVRVIRPGRYEENPHMEVLDTGAVSIGAPENITSVLYTSAGVGSARRFGLRMQLIASLIGCIAVLLLIIFKQDMLLTILSITLYQLFWTLVSLIATHSELNHSTLRLHR